jgi:crossover junction endodeoxyribonuclease RuvC
MASTILGIDPGLRITGYALLSSNANSVDLIEAGTLKTTDGESLENRLKSIYEGLEEVISEYRPDAVSVERLYSHYKHPQTAVVMGHARGIIYLCAANHKLPLNSYASTRIKKALTGNGRASKIQMQRAVMNKFKMIKLPEPPDIADAIAAALCHIEAEK